MEKYNSIWDMYQKKGMSRRSFIKACTAMAAMLGIAPSMLSEVVEAAEKRLPVVVWLSWSNVQVFDKALQHEEQHNW